MWNGELLLACFYCFRDTPLGILNSRMDSWWRAGGELVESWVNSDQPSVGTLTLTLPLTFPIVARDTVGVASIPDGDWTTGTGLYRRKGRYIE